MFSFGGDGFDAGDLLGLEIAGAFGYGAGLSEAEERESYLREKYEDELNRKNKRIEELEDELDDLRDSHYDDYCNDEDDEDENDYDDEDDYSASNKGRGGLEKYFYDNYEYFDYAEYALDHPGEDPEAVIFDVIEFKAALSEAKKNRA